MTFPQFMVCCAILTCMNYISSEIYDMFIKPLISGFTYRCIIGIGSLMLYSPIKNALMQKFIIFNSCMILICNTFVNWNDINRSVKFVGSCAVLTMLVYVITVKLS